MQIHQVLLVCLLCPLGCRRTSIPDEAEVRSTISRYNQLLAQGYRRLNMSSLRAVATPAHAQKAYFHMAAMGEGRLRLESTLKDVQFQKVELLRANRATAVTREVWDFRHVDIGSGKVFAEETDFVYEMTYVLEKRGGKWMVTDVTTVRGTSTHTVVPWPEVDRQGRGTRLEGRQPREVDRGETP